MTQSETARANRQGSPCPRWCTADHGMELFPGRYADTHSSDAVLPPGTLGSKAYVIGDGRVLQFSKPEPDKVMASAGNGRAFDLEAGSAERFAEFLEGLADTQPAEIIRLAAAVRAAAAIARESE